MGNILRDKVSDRYGVVGGQPLKPDKILYCLVGGAVAYAIKGIGIFEWFWAEGHGMVGLILKASNIEISISSVAFVHTMRPLENITSPRYFLPIALGLDFVRICCSLFVNLDRSNDNRYGTIKKIGEIITGYLIRYIVTLGYVSYFVVEFDGKNMATMSAQGYGVIFKCRLASVLGCCFSEGTFRFILANV